MLSAAAIRCPLESAGSPTPLSTTSPASRSPALSCPVDPSVSPPSLSTTSPSSSSSLAGAAGAVLRVAPIVPGYLSETAPCRCCCAAPCALSPLSVLMMLVVKERFFRLDGRVLKHVTPNRARKSGPCDSKSCQKLVSHGGLHFGTTLAQKSTCLLTINLGCCFGHAWCKFRS